MLLHLGGVMATEFYPDVGEIISANQKTLIRSLEEPWLWHPWHRLLGDDFMVGSALTPV